MIISSKLTKRYQNAFTLVELSIVLVIIGLLTAGVVGGASLIKSAKRQAVVKDFNNFSTAYNAYKLEYDAVPGDHKDATSYWGTETVVGGTGTANGSGDGKIDIPAEIYRAWEHLGLSGIINNQYSGSPKASCTASCYDPGVNLPKGRIKDTQWYILFNQNTGFGNRFSKFGNVITHEVLTPVDAENIDKKMDDGKPDTGNLSSLNDANCSSTSGYNLSYTGESCFAIWMVERGI